MIKVFFTLLNFFQGTSYFLSKELQGSQPLFINCKLINESYTEFSNDRFFYDSLSNYGLSTNLDVITFHMWFSVHSNMILDGKQILFSFVDGYGFDSGLNLMVYYQKDMLGQYSFGISNSKVNPEKTKFQIVQSNDLYMGTWNYFLLSINQQSDNVFINMKFFSSSDQQLQQLQDVLTQQKFIYSFGPHSRITNQQLFEKTQDYKACVNIANFYYINDFYTSDSELYVDYDVKLLFQLKPYQNNLKVGIENAILKQTENIEFSGSIGLNIYKNTQIVYNFQQDLSSFTCGFWIKPQNVQQYQFFSFTDDLVQQTSIGFGIKNVDSFYLFKPSNQIIIGKISDSNWNHIIVSFLELSMDDNFQAIGQQKLVRAFIDSIEEFSDTLYNFNAFQRLVIGSLVLYNGLNEVIDIQDIKIFSGFGIMQSKSDCQIFVGFYCLFCKPGTHYCKEQDPLDDTNILNCPARFKQSQNGIKCEPILIQNCLRMKDNFCEKCLDGYNFINGQCIFDSYQNFKPYTCLDINAQLCKKVNQKINTVETSQETSILCQAGKNEYDSNIFQCQGSVVSNCLQSQYSSKCYKCSSQYYLTSQQQCYKFCFQTGINKFRDDSLENMICQPFCKQGRYIFTKICSVNSEVIDYYCDSKISCDHQEIDLLYTCLKQEQSIIGFSQVCKMKDGKLSSQIIKCKSSCKYCYGESDYNCLGCFDGFYFSPYLSACLKSCSDFQNRFIYHNKVQMICEYQCPQNMLYQEDFCVKNCENGYAQNQNRCIKINSLVEFYLDSNSQLALCPVLCLTCESNIKCTKCLNQFPLYNDKCLFSCYPLYLMYDNDQNICLDICDSTQLIYENSNFNGYSINQCFLKKCGLILANKFYQTFQHQTALNRCSLPCDDGYYGDRDTMQCKKCSDNCATCQNKEHFCITCFEKQFLVDNSCFDNCGRKKYQNFITSTCEGTCSQGLVIFDQIEKIRACVSYCGSIYTDYKYSWNGFCFIKPPDNTFCVDNICFNCHTACKSCQGPLESDCLSCYDNFYLRNNYCGEDCEIQKYNKIIWECVDDCPQNTFQTLGTEIINNYPLKVISCYITCLYQQYQLRDQCYDKQPENSYCDKRSNYYFCEKCAQECKICTNAYTNSCSECVQGAYLYHTTCYYECPQEAPFIDKTTQQCVVQCSNYSEDEFCVQICQSTSYIYEPLKQCYSSSCPLGTYSQYGQNQCLKCFLGCSSCTGLFSNECESCFQGYFLGTDFTCKQECLQNPNFIQDQINNKCVQICPSGSYLQKLQNGVLACKDNCPAYYYSNLCVSACPSQTFISGVECINCAEPCSICFGTEVNQCNECDQGYFRDETTCLSECPTLKPYKDLSQQSCVFACTEIQYLYLAQMLCFNACPSFLYNYDLNGKKECVEQCYEKSYLNGIDCYQCNSICKLCFGPNNGNCLECELPYYLYQQTCQLTCPLFHDTIDQKCKNACPLDLVVQDQFCKIECDQGYFIYNQICLNQCPQFTFQQSSKCVDCHSTCLTCFGAQSNQCNSCIDGYFLFETTCQQVCQNYYDQIGKKCLLNCNGKLILNDKKECVETCPLNYINCNGICFIDIPNGYYKSGALCLKCNFQCSICISSSICLACKQNYYLEVNQCVNRCQNTFLYMDPISKSCVSQCPPQLYHLQSFDKKFCVYDCPKKFSNKCLDECPSQMYVDNKICKNCPDKCQNCENFNKCTSCIDGYFLENGQCLINCINGKTDRVNLKCVSVCNPILYEFQNECLLSCPTNPLTYKFQKQCLLSCPLKTYLDYQECFECDSKCTKCFGPTNQDCFECKQGYYLDNQKCSLVCPVLYDQVNFTCVVTCPNHLFAENSNCVSLCSKYIYKNQCIDDCPTSTYLQDYNCIDCSENCFECNETECIQCSTPTYLLQGLCNINCPILFDNTQNQCVEVCPSGSFQFVNNCYFECPVDTFEYGNNCLLTCPAKMIQKNRKCFDCPERCYECLDDVTCIICQTSYYLYDGQCYITCPLIMPYADIQNGICLSQCAPDTYIKQFDCVKSCDLIIYQNQCLDKCPSGYYGKDICKPCKLECKECNDYDICTQCNDNYFLEFNQCDTQCTKIKDIQKKQCVDTCDSLLYKNFCYSSCPISTYQFNNICVIKCIDGYYGSDEWKCEKCSIKCSICSTLTKCSKCRTGYFLYQNECLEECPKELFGDPILNKCTNNCPIQTYAHANQCVYNCPENYYNDSQNYKCVQNCSTQQYLIKSTCYQCSIECDGCYAEGNNNCLKCLPDYKLDENGYCQGSKCKVGYYKSENSCLKCPHRCLTCENDTVCTKCRGNNRKSTDCLCEVGYYDNEFYENCQKCPCDECTSEDNCLICKNNLQLPKCSCDRQLNDEWCITCQVGKIDIKFSEDLNQIIVYFGYLVTVNLINPFQPSDCSLWFDNSEQFGTNSTCYLSWDRYSILINLKPYSQINIGDELLFKQNFYRDVDKGLCDQEFISIFIENKVQGPNALTRPHVEFTIPQFVSACKEIEIKQILLSGTAQRLQKILFWQLGNMENEEYYLQMDSFLAQQSNEIFIPINTLQPNTTYKITAKYMNMLERVNYTTFTFTTLPIQATYVYLTFEPLIANVYVFDCHISFSDMSISFFIQIDIVSKEDPLINYISQQEQINPIYKVQLNETLLPKEIPLIFRGSTGSSIIIESFILKSKEIEIEFLQKNRFIGLDNQINARGYDRNIKDQILSTKDITYEWLCTNLHNLQPCKTDENKIMEFPSRRIANIYADSQNTTLVFYVKASKQNRWSVKEQMIVVTDFNVEEEFYYNEDTPKNYINPNDEITIVIKNQQNYAFILQQHSVLLSQKIIGSTLKFRLSDYSTNIIHPIYIYLIPGKESIAFQLNNPPPKIIFTIFPLKGKALDYFNYTIENLNEGSKASIYYYFENSKLENDVNKQQTLNGIPLVMNSIELSGQFQLPNGISDNSIAVLCQVTAVYGAKSFYTQQVQVLRQNYQLSNLISSFTINQNQTSSLNSLHTKITIIQLEQEQVCLKQCSGVGTCINQKCECPPGYYFDDCSGDQQQYSNFLQLIKNASQQIMKQNISNNDEFKLFTQTLNYLTKFPNINEGLSIEDCLYILKQYISNTNSRLEQINQYQINLQYHSTGDFNFSQIDIRSIVNYNDLLIAIDSTVFMWNKTLSSQDSNIYQLSNYIEQFINNVIDLSLISMTYDQEIQFTVDVADIKIKKTSNLTKILDQISELKTRILSNEQINCYDVILAVYISNFYAQDGYFPYPDQRYPLYDYSIRNSNKKQNIELSNNISYKYGIQNNTFNLVCLTRNQTTFQWQNDFCYMDKINSTYFCNCSILAPTTIVNDIQYLYQGDYPFYLQLPNLFLYIYIFQIIILLLVIYLAKNKKGENVNPRDNIKYGQVFKLIKNKRVLGFNNEQKDRNDQKQYFKKKTEELLPINNKTSELKFHLNQFWKYHVLTSIIYNPKFYLSLVIRFIHQLIKLNLTAIFGQLLVILNYSLLIVMLSTFGCVIFLRIIEKLINKQIKYFSYRQQNIILFIIKFLLWILLLSSLFIMIILNFKIENQTNLILSYTTFIIIDWLILDITMFTVNRFLGQEMKKQIRDKLKIFNKQIDQQLKN